MYIRNIAFYTKKTMRYIRNYLYNNGFFFSITLRMYEKQ